MQKPKLSLITIAFNEEKTLANMLESANDYADEIIIVIDDKTSDNTLNIAKKYTDKIWLQPHQENFHILKQFALEKAQGEWLLWMDADEELTIEIKHEIDEIVNSRDSEFVGYKFPRKNIIFNKWIQYSGWYPDYQSRLFRKGSVHFPCKTVHEQPIINSKLGKLRNPIIHYNYRNIFQYIDKLNRYTEIDAQIRFKDVSDNFFINSIHYPLDEFVKRYIKLQGYKDGLHGLVLALLQAFYQLVVLLKIWEKNKFIQEKVHNPLKKTSKEINYLRYIWIWWFYQDKIISNSSQAYKFRLLRKLKLLLNPNS